MQLLFHETDNWFLIVDSQFHLAIDFPHFDQWEGTALYRYTAFGDVTLVS